VGPGTLYEVTFYAVAWSIPLRKLWNGPGSVANFFVDHVGMIESEILDLAESSMLWHLTNRKCHSGLPIIKLMTPTKCWQQSCHRANVQSTCRGVAQHSTTKLQSLVASANPDGMSCQDVRVVGNPGFGGVAGRGVGNPENHENHENDPRKGGCPGGVENTQI
jgi:hypothetical protein